MDTESVEKKCTRCGVIKPLTEFYKDRRTKNGLTFWCKPCSSQNPPKTDYIHKRGGGAPRRYHTVEDKRAALKDNQIRHKRKDERRWNRQARNRHLLRRYGITI